MFSVLMHISVLYIEWLPSHQAFQRRCQVGRCNSCSLLYLVEQVHCSCHLFQLQLLYNVRSLQPSLFTLTPTVVCEHFVAGCCNKDVAYENIMKRPTEQLQMLADALNISEKVKHGSEGYDLSYN